MDELITKHLTGAATDIEVRNLERWRAATPENEAEYQQMKALWELAGADRPVGVPGPPALAEITAAAEHRRRRERTRRGWQAAIRSPLAGYGLAAAAIAGLLLVRGMEGPQAPVASLTPVESTASAGDVVTMSLSDGSVVRVARSTTIEFPPAEGERLVRLSGRAFFAVAHGDDPFVVRTALGDVTVHGTRFEVSVDGDALRLVVVEGSVSLSGAAGAVEVAAGHVAHLGREGVPRVVATTDAWSLLDWDGGLLLFQETPLQEVAGELRRHFGVPVVVNEALRDRRVTVWFSDEPLEEVVAAVCLVAGAACEVGSESVRVGR